MENVAFQPFFATRKAIRLIAPIQKPRMPANISSLESQERLAHFLHDVELAAATFSEAEKARVQARVESKNLDNFNSRSLIRKINREQRDKSDFFPSLEKIIVAKSWEATLKPFSLCPALL